jgi:hypothetical protein
VDRYTLYPDTLDVLEFQFKDTVCCVATAPVPESAIVVGEPVALLVIVTLPLAAPAAVGLKCTVIVRVCDAVNVTGVPAPLKLYPVPLTVI